MAYAKACKYGCNTQIIWDSAASKFKENATGEFHTRERCEAAKGIAGLGKYNKQEQKEFVEQYRPEQKSERVQDIAAILSKLDIILDKLNYIINHNPSERENQILKQKVTELEEVIKKQGNNFVPANQVMTDKYETEIPDITQKDIDHDQHVRDMVAKGRQASEEGEELEL